MKLKAQNQYNRNKSVNYYQSYHNTTRRIYHQKNDLGLKKTTVQGFKGSEVRIFHLRRLRICAKLKGLARALIGKGKKVSTIEYHGRINRIGNFGTLEPARRTSL